MLGSDVLIILLIGALSGWFSGVIMKNDGLGIFGNIIIGLLGAIVGGALFGMIGSTETNSALVGAMITAALGSVVFLFLIRLAKIPE